MEQRRLGRSGLAVSAVGLGCNNFGRRLDLDGTRAVVDACLEAGITFFDTADVYGATQSETFLGEVLASFEWAALDAALARAELAGVELKVTLSRALHPDNDPAAIRAAVVGFLPRAEERGVLCVRCA